MNIKIELEYFIAPQKQKIPLIIISNFSFSRAINNFSVKTKMLA